MNTAVPRYASTFVGRATDLDALDAMFARGARVVTVAGPGGVGKTRLVCEHAHRTSAPVVFCDLTAARDAAGVCAALAHALDVRLDVGGGASVTTRLGRMLGSRGAVRVVLDNFEQVVDAAPATLIPWLALAPEARFLVTSRELLRVDGEFVLDLGPLALPSPDADDDAIRACEAMQLLNDRIAQRPTMHALTPATLSTAAQIVRQLDGIPLAIELASARIGALGATAVRDLLGRRLDLLSRATRDGAGRARTLRAVIDWSWELLAPGERALLSRCAVFRGGFTVEALEAVAGDAAFGPTFDRLHALMDKSMVRAIPPGTPEGEGRYDLYLTIGEYAAERLVESGDADDAEARHIAYYAGATEALADPWRGALQPRAIALLLAERGNAFAAVERSLARERDDTSAALRTLVAVYAPVTQQGPIETYLALLDRVLAGYDTGIDPALRVRALLVRGRLRLRAGRRTEAREDLVTAVAIAEGLPDRGLLGYALSDLGEARRNLADASASDGSREALERALALHLETGDALFEGRTRSMLASLAYEQSHMAEALDGFRRSLDAFRVTGSKPYVAAAHNHLAIALLACGELDQAHREIEASLAICDSLGLLAWTEGAARGVLGLVLHALGRPADAVPVYRTSVERMRSTGDKRFEGVNMAYLALALHDVGQVAAAHDELVTARTMLRETGDSAYASLFDAYAALFEAETLGADATELSSRFETAAAAVQQTPEPLRSIGRIQRVHFDTLAGRVDDPEDALRAALDATDALWRRGADVQLAERFARRAIAARRPGTGATARVAGGDVQVHRDERWFRAPDGAVVACARRPTLFAVLVSLVDRAREAPGEPVAAADLFATAWPGERVAAGVAKNRLKVMIAELRKLGLRDVLASDARGYWLDPVATPSFADETTRLARSVP